MTDYWTPGTNAMVTAANRRDEYRAYFDGNTWRECDGNMFCVDVPTSVRPLVVLDPAQLPLGYGAEALGHLPAWLRIAADKADAHDSCTGGLGDPAGHGTILRGLADQIEEQTKPAKPEEPTGLGAVVEDGEGERFILLRHPEDDDTDWIHSRTGDLYSWLSIDAVRVLSEGVRP